MKKHELKYVAVEYKYGWSLWIERGFKKTLVASAVSTESELDELIGSPTVEKTPYVKKIDPETEQLRKKVAELEQYKVKFETLSKTIQSISETNKIVEKSKPRDMSLEPDTVFWS